MYPDLDAVGGRSYKQSSQTAGALSGRRDVVQWYSKEGAVAANLLCAFWLGTSVRWGVWNTGDTSWTGLLLPNGYGSADNEMGCRALTANLWFIFSWRQHETYDGRTKRTKDGGATWADFPLPETDYDWQDIARASDGRLWAITQLDRRPYIQRDIKIWYSDTDGDSWVESHAASLNAQEIYYIAVHPTDPDIIVAFGYQYWNAVTYVTQNRGSSWTQYNISDVVGNPLRGHEAEIVILDTGRLVVCCHEFATTYAGVMVSDNYGASWAFKVTYGIRSGNNRVVGPVRNEDSSRLFALWVDGEGSGGERWVIESTDRGDTWVVYDTEVPYSYTFSGQGYGGIAYDRNKDAIYVGNRNLSGDGLKVIMKMSPALAVGGIWEDVSGDIESLAPATFRFDPDWGQRIAAIPS